MNSEIEARTLSELVYRQIREDILAGRLSPGDKLRIERLREAYGVGASPLREALSRLSSVGLVTAEGQRGFRVASASVEELLDITKNRVWVETLALRSAIARGDRDWEAEVVAAAHRLRGLTPTSSGGPGVVNEWDRANRQFHTALVAACGSPQLLAFRELLYDLSDRYRRMSLQRGMNGRDLEREHEQLTRAVLERDAAKAVELIEHHFIETTRIILAADPKIGEHAAAMIEALRREVRSGTGTAKTAAYPAGRTRIRR